jgi:alpha-tubulin suppressor-like RCC1 family protein
MSLYQDSAMIRARRRPLSLLLLVVASLLGLFAPAAPVSADASDTGASNRAVASTLSLGGSHACYVANGSVYCWGSNSQGQLGRDPNDAGDPVTRSAVPLVVPGLSNVTAVAAGALHTCVLRSDTKVYCFGQSGTAVGNISSGITYVPNLVLTGATGITAGGNHSCAVLTGGSVRCWGNGFNGELGNGATGSTPTPVEALDGTDPAVSVSAGSAHTCAVLQSGAVKCWGQNNEGQLGNGTSGGTSTTPVDVIVSTGGTQALLGNAVSVSAGSSHTCAVTSAGGAYCWGSNMYREIGNNVSSARETIGAAVVASPGSGSPITNAAGISAGTYFSCVLRTTGAVACFGDNSSGKVGNGDAGSSADTGPVTVGNVTSAQVVTTGSDFACAMSVSTIWCWGNSSAGRLGNGVTATSSVASAVSTLPFLGQSVTFASLTDDALASGTRTLSATSSSGGGVSFSSTTASVCTVSGTTVTYVSPGTCTVVASRATNGMFSAATDVSRSFAISGVKPTAQTSAATSVSGSRATLNAVVNPSGLASTVKFVYGQKADLSDGASQAATVATSMSDTDVSTTVTGLTERTKYYFRVEATNDQGTSKGDILSFTTARPVGVTVNDAAEFTNKRTVTVSVTGPTGSAQAILSNDGGFSDSKTFTLTDASADIPWTLVASKDERLPKVVYVKFVTRLGSASTPYQDDIILDTTAPTMTGTTAAATAPSSGAVTVAAARGGVRMTVRASDKNSGIGKVQVKTSASGRITDVATGSPKATSRTVRVNTKKTRLWVRVVDRAGNASKWVTVTVK